MTAGYGGMRWYAEWLVFMHEVTSKIRLNVLSGRGGGFMKNVAVTFSVPKSIHECPLKDLLNFRSKSIAYQRARRDKQY